MHARRPALYLLAALPPSTPLAAVAEELCHQLTLAAPPTAEGIADEGEGEEERRLLLLTRLLPQLRHRPLALYLPRQDARPVERWAFDLDGTLLPDELLPQLAELYGQGEAMSRLTESAMQGEVPFSTSFTERTKLLAGLPADALHQLAERAYFPAGTERLLSQLAQADSPRALVSGNYLPLVQHLAQRLDIPHALGSTILTDEAGRLQGLAPAGIVDEARKRDFLLQWGDPLATCYVGDGANDLPALAAVGHAFLVGEGFVRAGRLEHLPPFLHQLQTNPPSR